MPSLTRSRGFTLVEVLVAFLVLSVGLLGLAGLQGTALRYQQAAYQRTVAGLALQDLAERMRANPWGQSGVRTDFEYNRVAAGGTRQTCISNLAAACNRAQLADHDAWEVNRYLARALPGGYLDTDRGAAWQLQTVFQVRWSDGLYCGGNGSDLCRETLYFSTWLAN